MSKPVEQCSLMIESLRLIRSCGKSLALISVDTGLPFWWLRKFHGKEIRDPSVNRVQLLYEYLTGTKLLPEPVLHVVNLEQPPGGAQTA